MKLELNKIYLMDALDGLRELDSECADIIIAEPPSNIGKDFGVYKDRKDLREYVEWWKLWINECIRILKPTGTMFIYGFSENLAYVFVEIPIKKRWLVWHYTNKNVPTLNFWQRSHESIVCCWKDKLIFNRDEIREPYTEAFLKHAAGRVRKETKGRFSRGVKKTTYKAHPRGALPRDVIKVPALAGGAGRREKVVRPAQKPVALCEILIKAAMPKSGGLVVVPFVGSGSECVAAKLLRLDFIGFETNPEYVRIAEERLAKVEIN